MSRNGGEQRVMQDIVFSGTIELEKPPVIQIGIRATGDDLSQELTGFGIIDIGSKQCIINTGVFDKEFFIDKNDSCFVDGIGRAFNSRCREMVVRLIQGNGEKEFTVPVYEMTVGTFSHGMPAMLIGRTILNQGLLIYDGRNQKWNMIFSNV
jgi:hypothetical protein